MISNKLLVKYVILMFVLKTCVLVLDNWILSNGIQINFSLLPYSIRGIHVHIIFCLYLGCSRPQYRESWNPLLLRHLYGFIILQKTIDIVLMFHSVLLKEWYEGGRYFLSIADWLVFVIYWLSLLVMIKRTPKAVDTLGNKIIN